MSNRSFFTHVTLLIFSLVVCVSAGLAQTTVFTYQGKLTNGGTPANGAFDLQFKLFDAASGGVQQSAMLTLEDVTVTNGVFTVQLDFGAAVFPGGARFLEVGVRLGTSTGAFSLLTPRSPVQSTPYALRSLNAGNADNATTAVTATNATNATTAVSFSGALSGDVAGNQSTTTVEKLRNVTLPAPVAADNGKVLKYKNNGVDPITFEWAADNTATGGVTSVTATAPLASSGGLTPNISLTGIVSVANGGTGANLSATGGAGQYLKQASVGGTVTVGTIAAGDVPDLSATYIKNGITPQPTSNFNISGDGTAGGSLSGNIVNTMMQYNIEGSRVLSIAGTENTFLGINSGNSNSASFNSFFGNKAGQNNTTGETNSFFGGSAGLVNTTGQANSFFGYGAGSNNTTASWNAFFGRNAGNSNQTGHSNAFFGYFAGRSNNTACCNSFFGYEAGRNNISGEANAFFGQSAGLSNTSEHNNTFLGAQSNGVAGLTNATALGYRAQVTQSNSLVLGSINGTNGATVDTKVGIGTTAPSEKLEVAGKLKLTGTGNGIVFPDGSLQTTADGGGVTDVTASAPLASSGGSTPNLSLTGIVPVTNGGTGANLSATGGAGQYLKQTSAGSVVSVGTIPAADIPDLGTAYVRNSTSQQAGANFNISGNGTVGGIISGNVVDATTQYNLGGNRILSNAGTDNLFAGVGAGASNTTGFANTFFGSLAGFSNMLITSQKYIS